LAAFAEAAASCASRSALRWAFSSWRLLIAAERYTVAPAIGSLLALGRASAPPTLRAVRAYTLARLTALPLIVLFASTRTDPLGTAGWVALALSVVWGLVSAAVVLRSGRRPTFTAGVLIGDTLGVLAIIAVTGGAQSGLRPLVPVLLLAPVLVFDPRTTLSFCVLFGVGVLVVLLPDVIDGDSWNEIVRTEGAIVWVTVVAYMLSRVRSDYEARLERGAESRRQLLASVLELDASRRRQFSTDLHEGPLQLLLTARQDLEEAEGGETEGRARAEEAVVEAVARLRDVIAEVHPVALDHGGLPAALSVLAQNAGRRGGFTAEVTVDERAAGLADEVVVDIARMALDHVALGRGVTAVRVDAGVHDGWLTLTVGDDGADFSDEHAPDSLALATAAERVAALGGALDVAPAAGGGMTLTARLPLA
jgi:two-component system NarL family sensor kinase